MKLRMQILVSGIVDPTARHIQSTIARLRPHKPKPWQCRHQWKPCHIVIIGQPGRYCPRCTALETRQPGQPLGHPESMAILLPACDEKALAELDEVLWPGEAV